MFFVPLRLFVFRVASRAQKCDMEFNQCCNELFDARASSLETFCLPSLSGSGHLAHDAFSPCVQCKCQKDRSFAEGACELGDTCAFCFAECGSPPFVTLRSTVPTGSFWLVSICHAVEASPIFRMLQSLADIFGCNLLIFYVVLCGWGAFVLNRGLSSHSGRFFVVVVKLTQFCTFVSFQCCHDDAQSDSTIISKYFSGSFKSFSFRHRSEALVFLALYGKTTSKNWKLLS